MRINDEKINWDSLGKEFLKKYSKSSSRITLVSDVNRIVDFFKCIEDDRQIHEINRIDIERNIAMHINKEMNALKSQNSVYKYIGRWNDFLEFLRIDKNYTHTHVFIDRISSLREFKEYINNKYDLKNKEIQQSYDINQILEVLKVVDQKIKNNEVTENQRYRLLEQSIYIQLTLITGLPRRDLRIIKVSDIISDNSVFRIKNQEINIPRGTSKYLEKYLNIRKENENHGFLFTKPNGDKIKTDNDMATLMNTNDTLVGIFREVDILDEEENGYSAIALRNTAILQMIKTKEDLYYIIRLSGINDKSISELDNLYGQIFTSEQEKKLAIKKNINILVQRLPYYDKLNNDEDFFLL